MKLQILRRKLKRGKQLTDLDPQREILDRREAGVAASRRILGARIRVLERELGNVRGKEGMREWE